MAFIIPALNLKNFVYIFIIQNLLYLYASYGLFGTLIKLLILAYWLTIGITGSIYLFDFIVLSNIQDFWDFMNISDILNPNNVEPSESLGSSSRDNGRGPQGPESNNNSNNEYGPYYDNSSSKYAKFADKLADRRNKVLEYRNSNNITNKSTDFSDLDVSFRGMKTLKNHEGFMARKVLGNDTRGSTVVNMDVISKIRNYKPN